MVAFFIDRIGARFEQIAPREYSNKLPVSAETTASRPISSLIMTSAAPLAGVSGVALNRSGSEVHRLQMNS